MARKRSRLSSIAGDLFMWLPPLAFVLVIFTDLGLYAASRAKMSDLSRDMAEKVATNRLPPDLVPTETRADLPLGEGTVTVSTFTDKDVIMDFSIRIEDATLFGVVGLFAGETMTVRSTVRRDPSIATVGWRAESQ